MEIKTIGEQPLRSLAKGKRTVIKAFRRYMKTPADKSTALVMFVTVAFGVVLGLLVLGSRGDERMNALADQSARDSEQFVKDIAAGHREMEESARLLLQEIKKFITAANIIEHEPEERPHD